MVFQQKLYKMIYNTVYQTTNLINNKIYVGVHTTKDPMDKYFGSSNYLLNDIKIYGKENFKKEILFYGFNEEDAYCVESIIVNKEFIIREDTYNIQIGGNFPPKNILKEDKIHKFWHEIYGIEECKRFELRKKYKEQKLDIKQLLKVINGFISNHKGWVLYSNKNKKYTKRDYNNYYKKINWIHNKHGSIFCNAKELIEIYSNKKLSLSRLCDIIKKNEGSHKGWSKDIIYKRPKTFKNNHNKIVHKFFHNNFDEETCTRYELCQKYKNQNLRTDALLYVIQQKQNNHRGWKVI